MSHVRFVFRNQLFGLDFGRFIATSNGFQKWPGLQTSTRVSLQSLFVILSKHFKIKSIIKLRYRVLEIEFLVQAYA